MPRHQQDTLGDASGRHVAGIDYITIATAHDDKQRAAKVVVPNLASESTRDDDDVFALVEWHEDTKSVASDDHHTQPAGHGSADTANDGHHSKPAGHKSADTNSGASHGHHTQPAGHKSADTASADTASADTVNATLKRSRLSTRIAMMNAARGAAGVSVASKELPLPTCKVTTQAGQRAASRASNVKNRTSRSAAGFLTASQRSHAPASTPSIPAARGTATKPAAPSKVIRTTGSGTARTVNMVRTAKKSLTPKTVNTGSSATQEAAKLQKARATKRGTYKSVNSKTATPISVSGAIGDTSPGSARSAATSNDPPENRPQMHPANPALLHIPFVGFGHDNFLRKHLPDAADYVDSKYTSQELLDALILRHGSYRFSTRLLARSRAFAKAADEANIGDLLYRYASHAHFHCREKGCRYHHDNHTGLLCGKGLTLGELECHWQEDHQSSHLYRCISNNCDSAADRNHGYDNIKSLIDHLHPKTQAAEARAVKRDVQPNPGNGI